MLSRHGRLRTKEVAEVLSKGRSVRGGAISMKYVGNKGPFRAAIIVPKALAGSAVMRNKLRRAAYDTLRLSPLVGKTGHALFFVRSVPKEPLRTAFRQEIEKLLATINTHV